ncbi:aspartate/glutamate racemase family protein [Alteribacillus sp. JSM 102045]|uniref:aspartate/glutamate racemase family protein n=1 Tax=Alteribacillus sp. JSM 102045 TaxID=1562101 RepID=UPI0035C154F7
MKVACIHALKSSLEPIDKAFQAAAPHIEIYHLMDTGMLYLLKKYKEITPAILRRLTDLCSKAEELKVDAIQMTCSAFNGVRDQIAPFASVPVFRSDEAVLEEASKYKKIGLIATVRETAPPLIKYLHQIGPATEVITEVNTLAMERLEKGERKGHDKLVLEMISSLKNKVEAVVLSQYSMAHTANMASQVEIPILTAPQASVRKCLSSFQKRGERIANN